MEFQSTLSSRRATLPWRCQGLDSSYFNPRSPHGERHALWHHHMAVQRISIHALLTESDPAVRGIQGTLSEISIHALLTESDVYLQPGVVQLVAISIHALLTESDHARTGSERSKTYFNPRSPHGERQEGRSSPARTERFQSTLSSRRATTISRIELKICFISIHALLTESDGRTNVKASSFKIFQSTLSSRRATANTTKLALSFLSKVPI